MQVIIAESQVVTLDALALLLGCEPDIQVIGKAGNHKDLLAQVKNKQPDIVLLDWQLAKSNPEGIIRDLKSAESRPQLIVMDVRSETYVDAKAAGTDYFFCKNNPPDQLLACIRELKLETVTKDNHQKDE